MLGDIILGQFEWFVGVEVIYLLLDNLYISVDVDYVLGQYFCGDEVNENCELDGYMLVNLSVIYVYFSGIIVGLCLENVFDIEFEIFGIYGEVDEVLEDIYDDIEFIEFVGFG